jgi:hypothetical protein
VVGDGGGKNFLTREGSEWIRVLYCHSVVSSKDEAFAWNENDHETHEIDETHERLTATGKAKALFVLFVYFVFFFDLAQHE